MVYNFKATTSASLELFKLNQGHASKKLVFLVKTLQNWGYNSYSHKKMLVLPKFAHMTTFKVQFESRDKVLLVPS